MSPLCLYADYCCQSSEPYRQSIKAPNITRQVVTEPLISLGNSSPFQIIYLIQNPEETLLASKDFAKIGLLGPAYKADSVNYRRTTELRS